MYDHEETSGYPYYLTVGVLLDSVDSYFNRRIIADLFQAGEEHSVHIVLFAGGPLSEETNLLSGVYRLPHPETIHALIVLPHAVFPANPQALVANLQQRFGPIPVYSLLAETPGAWCVAPDESQAIRDLVNHLAGYHAYRSFAFLTGPVRGNSLSAQRLKLLAQALEAHGIDKSAWRTLEASFRHEDGKAAISRVLGGEQGAPEVLVCLNDEMAIGAIQELAATGIAVPGDMAVTGFDDISENTSLPCLLSTIDYPVWEMITATLERIISDHNQSTNYETATVTYPARFMHRESCGCQGLLEDQLTSLEDFTPQDSPRSSSHRLKRAALARRNLQSALEKSITEDNAAHFADVFQPIMSEMARAGDFTNAFVDTFSTLWTATLLKHPEQDRQILINSLFIDAFRQLVQSRTRAFQHIHETDMGVLAFYRFSNHLLSRSLDVASTLKGIVSQLPLIGVTRCVIAALQAETPHIAEIRLSWRKQYFSELPLPSTLRIPAHTLLDSGISSIREHLLVMPLEHAGESFGYIVFAVSDKQLETLGSVARQISRLLVAARMNEMNEQNSEAMQTHIRVLTRQNTDLSRLSEIDELTGLANRRALYTTGKARYLESLEQKKGCCCIFLDMDGLKIINDTYGHRDGDAAISALANALKRSFRDDDLLIRYGGDEFVVLMFNITEEVVTAVLARIQGELDRFNESGSWPWTLSASWGHLFIPDNSGSIGFEQLLETTDALLYEAKKAKKKVR